ncbi:MAG TPA: hypothetical protein VM488_06315, partial [Pseudobacter sp.]|nr:hypothetical protein [Pseudobacter sp.]
MIFNPGNLTLTFWNLIKPADTWLITHINQNWGNDFLDTVLPYMRESYTWVPLYLFLLLFVTMNFRLKGWWWFVGAIVTAALADV